MNTNAVIYLRESVVIDDDTNGIDRHREVCQELAADRGYTVLREYVDNGISAHNRTKTRPAYQRMMRDIQTDEVDVVICYDLDRLTRQPRELEDWIDRAAEHAVIVLTANGEADLSTDSGRMYARVKAAVAANEVERKAARQSLAQKQRAQQGRPPSGIRPLGYTQDATIIEDEAEAVRAIYQAVYDKYSLRDITRALNGEDLPGLPPVPTTPRHTHVLDLERNARRRAKGAPEKPVTPAFPWRPTTLHAILHNPRYAGYSIRTDRTQRGKQQNSNRVNSIVRNNDGDPVMGHWTPIIEPELWWDVQTILNDPKRKTNRTGSNSRKHVGAGLYQCYQCESTVKTHGTRYRCAGHIMRSMKQVDKFVEDTIITRLARDDLADLLIGDTNEKVREIKAKIAESEYKIKRAQNDYDTEVIEGLDLKRIRDNQREIIRQLTGQRNQLTVNNHASDILGTEDPVKAYLDATMPERRTVIDVLCTVILHPAPRGRRTFNPASIEIRWKNA